MESERPFVRGYAVTPSDDINLPWRPRGLYVGATGAVAVIMEDGTALTFAAAQAGSILRISPIRVKATGTVATGIIALR